MGVAGLKRACSIRVEVKATNPARAFVVLVLLLTGCATPVRPSPSDLEATLPTDIAGLSLDLIQVVDEHFLVGHPIDDPLDRLGKARRDAPVVFRESSEGFGGLGAATVDGVDGPALLEAVVQTWAAPTVTGRAREVVGNRQVWILLEVDGATTYVYAVGQVVYFAFSSDPAHAKAFAEALP